MLAAYLSGIVSLLILKAIAVAPLARLGWASPVILLPVLIAYWAGGLYPGIGLHPVVEFRKIVKLNTFVFLGVLLASMIELAPARSSAFFAISWAFSVAAMPLARGAARNWSARRLWWGYPALIIGCSKGAEKVLATLQETPRTGLRPVGLIDLSERRDDDSSITICTRRAAMADALIEKFAIPYGIVAMPDLSRHEIVELINHCSSQVPHLLLLSNCDDVPSLWNAPRLCGSMPGTEVRNGLMLASLRGIKRAMDFGFAASATLIASPLIAAILVLVKLSSPGPVFYGHRRIGLQGGSFKAWKFRTMHVDGDEILRRHLSSNPEAREEWERDHKLRNDPRVTSVGRLLRKLSLDELPQLWNVLKGEMSMVGPRPIVDEEVEKYGRVYSLYTGVVPGITGLWQISGRNDTTYGQRVRLDSYYVRNWSPWLDVYILARTPLAVLCGKGAC